MIQIEKRRHEKVHHHPPVASVRKQKSSPIRGSCARRGTPEHDREGVSATRLPAFKTRAQRISFTRIQESVFFLISQQPFLDENSTKSKNLPPKGDHSTTTKFMNFPWKAQVPHKMEIYSFCFQLLPIVTENVHSFVNFLQGWLPTGNVSKTYCRFLNSNIAP